MAQYETGNNGSSMNFLFGVVVGALAGAGVALLLAPKSGAELRSDLNEQMGSLKESATRKVRDLKDRANAGWSEVQSAATNAAKSAERPV